MKATVLDCLYGLTLVFYLPRVLMRRRSVRSLWDRLTTESWRSLSASGGPRPLWVHAVSAGETAVAALFIRALKKRAPARSIVLSCVTDTGMSLARDRLRSRPVPVFRAPLDFSWCVRSVMAHINPSVYVSVETEIWPNLFTHLAQKQVPIVLINARLSDRSFDRYRRFSWFWRPVFKTIHRVAARSDEDAQRFAALGVPDERIRVTGNLKFAAVDANTAPPPRPRPWPASHFVLFGASTHSGEEDLLVETHRRLIACYPRARLVLAPRHVERAGEVARMIRSKGMTPLLWSAMTTVPSSRTNDPGTVLLVDRIGVLFSLYAWADAVFIGKTLTRGGGQNPIEPAVWGKPVIMGPRFDNFKDVVSSFMEDEAVVIVEDASGLDEQWRRWLSHPDEAAALGGRARRVVRRHQDALAETLDWLEPMLVKRDA